MLPTVSNATDSDNSFNAHACIHDLEWMHDVSNLTLGEKPIDHLRVPLSLSSKAGPSAKFSVCCYKKL